MIYTVIAKPTKLCNADCAYCCAPPYDPHMWNFDKFKIMADKIGPYFNKGGGSWIWHGGEPMLLGVEFYRQCYEYSQKMGYPFEFSMQSNLLKYGDSESERQSWRKLFKEVFNNRVSSSYDPDESQRSVLGNTEKYHQRFWRSMELLKEDGIYPYVISTYNEETIKMAMPFYEKLLGMGEHAFDVKFNFCAPVGYANGKTEMIKPKTYGQFLVDVYNRWITDLPVFTISPMNYMLKKILDDHNESVGRCPWTKSCGGHFLDIEPNGDVYNCSDFSDLMDNTFCYGNIYEKTVPELLASPAAMLIRQRNYKLPKDCTECEHFAVCEGGCMRDAILYKHGIGGKFHYCESWKMIFTRIKESILTGEADGALRKMNFDPMLAKKKVQQELQNHFSFTDEEAASLFMGAKSQLGFFDNFAVPTQTPQKEAALKIAQGIYPEPDSLSQLKKHGPAVYLKFQGKKAKELLVQVAKE